MAQKAILRAVRLDAQTDSLLTLMANGQAEGNRSFIIRRLIREAAGQKQSELAGETTGQQKEPEAANTPTSGERSSALSPRKEGCA